MPALRPALRAPHPVLRLAAPAAALALVAGSASAQTSFRALGAIIPGDSSWAYAVSADGSVVCGRSGTNYYYGSSGHAYRWSDADGIQDLDPLVGDSTAYGISADGTTIVGYENQGSRQIRAYVWTAATGMDHVYGGGMLLGIAASEQFCVGYDRVNSNDTFDRCVRWVMGDRNMQTLDDPAVTTQSRAIAASADGSVVVGTAAFIGIGQRAFRWTAATGLQNIGSPVAGGPISEALSISPDGVITIGDAGVPGTSYHHATRWTQAEGQQDLGTLTAFNLPSTVARGMSADGSRIVGSAQDQFGSSRRAFLWSAADGMQDLTTLLVGVIPPGWTAVDANGASADGQTIVGTAFDTSGRPQAFLAVIPTCAAPHPTNPPSTAALCAGGTTTLSVGPAGGGPMTYQWRHNSAAIPGASASTLTIQNASALDAGTYDCLLTNSCGQAATNPATLTYCPADLSCDGHIDIQDFLAFLQLYSAADPRADLTGDAAINIQDYLAFLSAYSSGCA